MATICTQNKPRPGQQAEEVRMEGSIILRRRRRTTAKSPWTQERVEYSTARWSEGASARQISRELGHGISRSAVLGLIYRLGIADLSPFGGRRGRRSNK